MNEQSGYITTGNERLHYYKWGVGKKLLLAFHGYGDTAEIFLSMADFLEAEYTILSVDLPHHGGSKWETISRLTSKDLGAIATSLMKEYNAGKISLIGYSLGGRICLAIAAQIPECIEKIVLIAPDGLKKDPYYYFFTRTWLGKKVFNNLLDRPGPYFAVMRLLKNARLVHHKRYKFAMNFLGTRESRDMLLRVWPAMNEVMPEPEQLKKIIATHHLPVIIFMGQHDKIIPPAIAMKFKQDLDSVQVFVIEKGHRMIDNETARQISGSLL